ncbi:hypothetical protein M9H77_18284 [Catharanthus roseus]|uniref:Uncharacterized protein n=1 Tax=Catharanthus roseus TaxID=4058 RepID=A0ACC0B707_CATRO|nr:hypothetical protein M9H77_18284 [Catharanthus roseus]
MGPRRSTASSSKSKKDRIEGSSPDPTTPDILPFPERLSLAARKTLKIVIEKSSNESVIEHLELERLFEGVGLGSSFTGMMIINRTTTDNKIHNFQQLRLFLGRGQQSMDPSSDEGWLRERNYASEDDETYDLSAEDAPPIVPMDEFQTEIRAAFEQLRVTQDIHASPLTEIVESTCRETTAAESAQEAVVAQQRSSPTVDGRVLPTILPFDVEDLPSMVGLPTVAVKDEATIRVGLGVHIAGHSWHLLSMVGHPAIRREQEGAFRGTKALLFSQLQVEEAKGSSLEDLDVLKSKKKEGLDPTVGGRIHPTIHGFRNKIWFRGLPTVRGRARHTVNGRSPVAEDIGSFTSLASSD